MSELCSKHKYVALSAVLEPWVDILILKACDWSLKTETVLDSGCKTLGLCFTRMLIGLFWGLAMVTTPVKTTNVRVSHCLYQHVGI